MKKLLLCAILSTLLLSSCAPNQTGVRNANEICDLVNKNQALLLNCIDQMQAFRQERIYVAMELPKKENDQEEIQESIQDPAAARLVSFEKETDDRIEIENETLQCAIETLGLELIFFQTSSDARQSVIFSFARENDEGIQNGFYYSFDALPCAWWGRRGNLKQKENRWIQLNENGSAWYYTVEIGNGFYYFEKQGSLLA